MNTLDSLSFARIPRQLAGIWIIGGIFISIYRDMFMHFQGGGIGHKTTHDWDKFLQQEGHTIPQDYDTDSDDNDKLSKPSEWFNKMSSGEDKVGDEGKEGQGGRDEDESKDEDDKDDKDRDNVDHVIANEGEELDDDIWAQEGYGAL
ncbi:hypothetical protein PAXRUDRAFT_155552 [Paxillus rubicundulus Ve08.2h10]|uniref:Unplaced genomic scaffold scaffold_932, whole genome shotgun sequence n=1 Tax=Paxillus rubicundulus Ve08.2h10 TaxID=930991 RepID=A0A0D0DJ64_9AGAM|nr:hypothetical protein PAXRUDRAFT_155552 [Paxillus rubicundulus Ve08.2h10]